jgi:hypothetical protein
MKSTYGSLAGAALTLALIPAAQAQTTMTGVGTCSGMTMINGRTLAGNTQLYVGDNVDQKKGALIPGSLGGAIFNKAECQCQSRDIRMHVILTTPAGQGTAPGASMFIGVAGCEDTTMQSTGVCDKITDQHPANNSGWSINGASFQNITPFDITIPPEVVTNPQTRANGPTADYTMCNTGGTQSYTITVAVGPDAMPNVCTLPVTVNTQGPTAPGGVTAKSGDGALTINWSVPSGTSGIDSYQILCRKVADRTHPAMSDEFLNNTRYYFSSCINHRLFRRTLVGLNTNSDPATDRSTIPTSGTDFPLDPRLRCSDKILAATTSLETRITGLDNSQDYELVVLAIDTSGNATPSAVVTGTPQPTVSPAGEFCEGDKCPGFGCQAGRAVPTGPGAGAGAAGLLTLALLLLGRRVRRGA